MSESPTAEQAREAAARVLSDFQQPGQSTAGAAWSAALTLAEYVAALPVEPAADWRENMLAEEETYWAQRFLKEGKPARAVGPFAADARLVADRDQWKQTACDFCGISYSSSDLSLCFSCRTRRG